MKIRNGFVSNSSSSSFIVVVDDSGGMLGNFDTVAEAQEYINNKGKKSYKTKIVDTEEQIKKELKEQKEKELKAKREAAKEAAKEAARAKEAELKKAFEENEMSELLS